MPSQNKTQPTDANAADFIAEVEDPARRADCQALVRLMQQATGERACMWGPSIVGFGSYAYRYESGRSGEAPLIGFSPRKGDLTLYLSAGFTRFPALMQRLGRHKVGKSCLYVKRLADVDQAALVELLAAAVAALAPKRVPSKAGT